MTRSWSQRVRRSSSSIATSAAGQPDTDRRERLPITYEDGAVGELWVDGVVERDELEQIAALIGPYVLIGWDTGGEAWEP